MDRIMQQAQDSQQLATAALTWITCAKRPLTTTELRHALAVEEETTELNHMNLPRIERIVSVSAGLVMVDADSDIVRLVHYTTQEYFEKTQNKWFPNAQRDITKTCITYLSFKTFESGLCPSYDKFSWRLQSNPLYDYAARNWGHHARQLSSLCKLAHDFLRHRAKVEASIQAYFMPENWRVRSEVAFRNSFPRGTTGLHLVAATGVHEALGFFQDFDFLDSNVTGRTPLSFAAESGHEKVVELLLAVDKAGINSADWVDRTPLNLAAAGGHKAVVELLLATNRAEINASDFRGMTPLCSAAENGHEDVVKALLATGRVEADSKEEYSRTPLSHEAMGGHAAIVKLLLATGEADINAEDVSGQTPLGFAAEGHVAAVMKMLLGTGRAKIDWKTTFGRTPLSFASEMGDEAIVRLLLATGQADVNSQDNNGWTPLGYAIVKGHEQVAKLLRDYRR